MIEPSMERLMQYLASLRKPEPSMMPPVQQPNPMEMLAMQAQQQQPQQNPLQMMLAQSAPNILQDRINNINAQTAEPTPSPRVTVPNASQQQSVVPEGYDAAAAADRMIREMAAQKAAQAQQSVTPKIEVIEIVPNVKDRTGTPVDGYKAADGWIYDSDPNDGYAEKIKRWK